MAALDVIGPLMTGMKVRADMAGLACESLNRMFQREQTELVAQVNTPTTFLMLKANREYLQYLFFCNKYHVLIPKYIVSFCVCVQALRVDLVPYLLKLLEGIGLETLENPSATKAQIVKALKSMTRSLQYGEQVTKSPT